MIVTVYLAITCAMLYQLSYEATDVGSRSTVGSYAPVKEMSVNDIWNKSNMNRRNEMKMKKWSSQWTIWFISYIINTHFFHGNIWTHNWPAPNISGFIAQLVEHHTGNREVMGSNPVEVLNFFQAPLRNCIKLIAFTATIISSFSRVTISSWLTKTSPRQ